MDASKGGSNTTHGESAGHIREEIVILDGDDSNGPAGQEVASNGPKTGNVTRPRPTLERVKESTKANSPTLPILPQRKHARVPKPKAKMPLRQAQKSGTDIGQKLDNADSVFSPDELVSRVLPSFNNSSDLKAHFASPEASTCREMVLAPNGSQAIATKLLNKNHNEGTWNPKLFDDALEIHGTPKKSTEIPKGTTSPDLETIYVTKDRIKRIVRVPDVTAVQGIQPRKNSLKRTLRDPNDDDCFEIPFGDVGESQVPPVEKDMSFDVKPAQSLLMSDKTATRKLPKKNQKPAKANPKKRQSAPAALGVTNSRRTSKRRAAIIANERLIEANSTDVEEQLNGEFKKEMPKPVQKDGKFSDQYTQQVDAATATPSPPRNGPTTMQQQVDPQKDSNLPVLVGANLHARLSDDLYGASPVKPTANRIPEGKPSPFDDLYDATPIKQTTRLRHTKVKVLDEHSRANSYTQVGTQKFQSLGEMAAKMNNLLDSLDQPDCSEDFSAKQVKVQANNKPRKLSNVACDKVLVNDNLCRKTPVVGFNEKGARNQGHSAMTTGLIGYSDADAQDEPATPVGTEQANDRKRKRQKASYGQNKSPPRKRQSLSPSLNRTPMLQGNSDQLFESSPPVQYRTDVHGKNSSVRRNDDVSTLQRLSKPSSQGSRVDRNGSPIATRCLQVDRIGNAKRKVLEDDALEVHTPEPTLPGALLTAGSPEIFGPKLRLGSIPKARPSSSLEETEPRYILHKKTRNGHYEGIGTNEIIEPEKALIDPFIEKTPRPTSGFSGRLLAGSSGVNEASKKLTKHTHHHTLDRIENNSSSLPIDLSKKKGVSRPTNNRLSKRFTEVFLDEDDDTLVEPVDRSPSEITNATTCDSRSPLADKSKAWNVAVRPHYTNLSETIHHIADEVIIRLANEEDAMKLIANQYKENGEKLLQQTSQKQGEEKAVMMREMDQTVDGMVALYTDAKGLADRTKQALKKTPLSAVEKDWKSRCEALKAQIDKGKSRSDESC